MLSAPSHRRAAIGMTPRTFFVPKVPNWPRGSPRSRIVRTMEDDLRTLPDALSVIRRRWLTVLAFVLLGVLAGVGLSLLQAPQYTATASVLLRSPVSQTAGSRALDPEEVATQADIVVSDEV